MNKVKNYLIRNGLALIVCIQSICVGLWSLIYPGNVFVDSWMLNFIMFLCGLFKLIGLILRKRMLKRIGLFGVAFVWILHMLSGIVIGFERGFRGVGWITSIFFVLLIWLEAYREDY